jgi:hypothetical protein
MKIPRSIVIRRSPLFVACAAAALCVTPALEAQILMTGNGPDGRVRLHTSDLAIFMAGEERDDLPCTVVPNEPVLGFDLQFHASYEVAMPLRELAGGGDLLSILFRVTPESRPREPVHFTQKIRVPDIEDDAKGTAYLHGTFDLGKGRYQVDWLMRDRLGRVCSSFWEAEANLEGKDSDIALSIEPSVVRPTQPEQFTEEPPVIRTKDASLNVKVLVNFAPQNEHAATLQPLDTSALVSILRTISREPRIGKFSVVAFNLHEQRVLYKQSNADRIDFPALGESLDSLELGTVDLARLSDKGGETRFLAKLMNREFRDEVQPDALILAGPKAMLGRSISKDDLALLGQVGYPIYYMNYNLNPRDMPWRDTIGSAVKHLNGREYTITRPRDLWHAVTEMVSSITEGKDGPQMVSTSSE